MKTYFTSDSHFFHGNIIKYCNRPWNSGKDDKDQLIVTDKNIDEMNKEIIKRWNSVVKKDDIVWHLGDFCLGSKHNIIDVFQKLNGRINLVMGNHDHHKFKHYLDVGFNRVYDRPVIIQEFIVLSHAPMQFVKAPMFNIYGHVHNCKTFKTVCEDSCCVCVERWNYFPVELELIKKIVETKDFDKYNNGVE